MVQRWKCLILSILCISSAIAAAICPVNGHCDACQLTLSTNVSGITDNTIRTTTGVELTFVVTFTNRGHNGFTFKSNDEIINPNFPCTPLGDTTEVTMTLEVYYHCFARVPGNYSIVSYVTFCDVDYYSQINYTVIAEDATPVTSSTSNLSMSSTSNSVLQPTSTISTSQPSSSSVVLSSAVMPTAVLPTNNTSGLPATTTDNGVTDPTETQDKGSSSTAVAISIISISLTAVICGAVMVIVIILLRKYRRSNQQRIPAAGTRYADFQKSEQGPTQAIELHRFDRGSTQATGDDLSTNDVRHGISAINYTPSGSSSSIAPSEFPAPSTESVSASLAHTEQVIVHSEPPTAVPEDASTPHQVS